jgi:hypothetical protein
MLLDEYRQERHKMHEMYKVRRADNAVRLHADFVSSQKKELAEDEKNRDRGMVKVGREREGEQGTPGTQTFACCCLCAAEKRLCALGKKARRPEASSTHPHTNQSTG